MRAYTLLLAILLAVSGCASIANWGQLGKSPLQIAQDKSECLQLSQQSNPGAANYGGQLAKDYDQESAFATCMRQRGYQEESSKPDNGVDR